MFDELQQMLPLMDEEVEFLPIMSLEGKEETQETPTYNTQEMPILPLRNMVLFPGIVVPITVGRDKSITAIREANNTDKNLGVIAQLDPDTDHPGFADLNKVGTVARIVRTLQMPNGSTTVILHGRHRFQLDSLSNNDPYLKAGISVLDNREVPDDTEFEAMIASMKELSIQIVNLSEHIPSEASMVLKNIDNPEFLIHFVSSNLNITSSEKQMLLQQSDMKKQAERVLTYLNTELQMLELKNQIQLKVKTDIDKQQRDYFLHQQLKTIQEELGDESSENDIVRLKERAKKKNWNEQVQKTFIKELKRLKRINPSAPDYSTLLHYLELLLDLPWNSFTKDMFDLRKAKKVLDKEHHGLEKIKQRIIEYLAVLKLKGDMRSPIICFVGPPGVGKTSLGRSIAKAIKRKFIRMSLGGLNDESGIRGHRKTYIGAMPGRIIQSLQKVQTSNPVFILDEIDKIGKNFRGDPSSALLEVLDPEQNSAFHDNYLEVDYDLSKIMFIATANSLTTIHPALRDRMEIIHISGYSLEEKIEIAKKHLIPKQREAHGLTGKNVQITAKILQQIINDYTRESGVRTLERKIAAVMRSVAKAVAMEEVYSPRITKEALVKILGVKRFDKEIYTDEHPAGVSVGLAWTTVGGEILFIETSLSEGKGALTLTGQLGDVMKESATTALSYLKGHAKDLNIPTDIFKKTNFHLHVPAGAIPKDGPSAGVAIVSALASAIMDEKIKPYVAMTGEITLRGRVLPVGGIKEKVLAAKRAGLKEIILCYSNRKDVEEIKEEYRNELTFHYVKHVQQVLDLVLNK